MTRTCIRQRLRIHCRYSTFASVTIYKPNIGDRFGDHVLNEWEMPKIIICYFIGAEPLRENLILV